MKEHKSKIQNEINSIGKKEQEKAFADADLDIQ
jgi:hypothetical protein